MIPEFYFFALGLFLTGVILFGIRKILTHARAEHLAQEKLESKEHPKSPVVSLEENPFASSKTLKQALENTEKNFWGRLKGVFEKANSSESLEEIEEILYSSDLGPRTVQRVLAKVQQGLSKSEQSDPEQVKAILKEEFAEIFRNANIGEAKGNIFSQLKLADTPTVWMVVGVNGAGKTTSIGKMAAHLAQMGKKVMVAAGDTFRAAAGAQLSVWSERAKVEIFSPVGVTDPSGVAYAAVQKGLAEKFDVVIIDTAGRLHTQANLMEELKKIKRVATKAYPAAPHEVLLVLDANSGQNALVQAKEFHKALDLTGIVLTKMDGTAKGGVAIGIAFELKLPIRLIGIGEKIGDMQAFSSKEFIESIF